IRRKRADAWNAITAAGRGAYRRSSGYVGFPIWSEGKKAYHGSDRSYMTRSNRRIHGRATPGQVIKKAGTANCGGSHATYETGDFLNPFLDGRSSSALRTSCGQQS